MKPLSQKTALERLRKLKANFRDMIARTFEYRAKSCVTCEVKGSCCLDAHFVNVHISRLEAVSVVHRLDLLDQQHRSEVLDRIDGTVEKYGLSESDEMFSQTFACPLFEKGTGCLIHESGKPLACITHACYESSSDMPPDDLLTEQELAVDALNRQAYRNKNRWLPLPLAIRNVLRRD